MTRMSKSKTRRVAAIGNSRVIPAKAGIQWLWKRCGRTTKATGFPLMTKLSGNDEPYLSACQIGRRVDVARYARIVCFDEL